MDIIKAENPDEAVTALLAHVEEKFKSKIFTYRILMVKDDTLDLLVVLEDKSMLSAKVFTELINGKLSVRMRGDLI